MKNKISFILILPVFFFAGAILPVTAFAQDYEDSKFGIFGAYSLEYQWFMEQMEFDDSDYWNWVDNHFENLGAHWTRSNNLVWELIEPTLGGAYDWDNIFNSDSVITNIYDSPADVNWLACPGFSDSRNPLDYPTEWQNFLQAAVERYNGDGINDLNEYVNVQYWQLGNEIMQISDSFSSGEYAQIVALSESAIHSVDLNAKICLIAPTQGFTVDTFLENTIIELSNLGVQFDIIDIHHWGNSNNYKMTVLPQYRTLLDNNGYINVDIWSCEHGTWCCQPDDVSYQTKTEQAVSLIKRYVWNLNNGLDKLFWNNLMEWHGFAGNPGSIYNSMGLIGDGSYCGEPANEFNYMRKNYYSYKKLAENIDTDKANFICNNSFHNESGGNYGYLYQDLITYDNFEIFWTDNDFATYSITITSGYKLTNMVPSDTLGTLDTQILSAGNHDLTIYKDEVYLLKKTEISSITKVQSNVYSIYPNPTTGIFTVDMLSAIKKGESIQLVEIININGQIVYSYNDLKSSYEFQVDLSNHPKGIYFVKIQTTDFIKVEKIIVE
ncbi:MAG: T9SS type A sorting domain-containing protein [Bacteroidales bacterium]|nr:T9SS type A sorting domain-containing protein [Bacteroidales bacterium]